MGIVKKEIVEFLLINRGVHFCGCGCGDHIKIKRHHWNTGVPKYISNHSKKGKSYSSPTIETRNKISNSLKGRKFEKRKNTKSRKKLAAFLWEKELKDIDKLKNRLMEFQRS